nr:MAG TPA: hypothetical protein [Caudoviricetes sp.]
MAHFGLILAARKIIFCAIGQEQVGRLCQLPGLNIFIGEVFNFPFSFYKRPN